MAIRMSDVLGRIADRGADGKLPLSDSKVLNGYLFPILKSDRILYGISVADTDGENYYVTDVGDGWRPSRTGDGKTGGQTLRPMAERIIVIATRLADGMMPTRACYPKKKARRITTPDNGPGSCRPCRPMRLSGLRLPGLMISKKSG